MSMRLDRERALGFVLLAICAALWFYVVPTFVEGDEPRFFPKLIVAWIALFALLTAILPPRAGSSEPEELDAHPTIAAEERYRPVEDVEAPLADGEDQPFPSVYGVMVIWGAYVLIIGPLGFYLATFLMLASSMFYLGIRSVLALVLRPGVALLVIYLLLDVALNFRLPDAMWQ